MKRVKLIWITNYVGYYVKNFRIESAYLNNKNWCYRFKWIAEREYAWFKDFKKEYKYVHGYVYVNWLIFLHIFNMFVCFMVYISNKKKSICILRIVKINHSLYY